MGLDSPKRQKKGDQFEAGRTAQALDAYKKENELASSIREQAGRLARISALALALQGCMPGEELIFAEMQTKQTTLTSEFLDRQVSEGSIRLASGETVAIPRPGDRFAQVQIYTPKEQAPKRAIIVFKQTHKANEDWLKNQTEEGRRDSLSRLMTSQKAIYEELKDMKIQGTISAVCAEGLVEGSQYAGNGNYYRKYLPSAVSETVASYLPGSDAGRAMRRWDEIFSDNHVSERELQELKTDIEPTMHGYATTDYRYAVGAENLLEAEEVLKRCPAESQEAYDAAWSEEVEAIKARPRDTWTDEERSFLQKVVYEDREDAAIKLSLSQGYPVIAIKYGALHDFSNNVEKWNKENPDDSIALVEVSVAR